MAPFVPLPAGAQVELVHQLDTQIITNRLWFVNDLPPFDQAALDGLAAGVATWWTDLILPGLSSDLITAAVVAKDWSAEPAPLTSVSVVLTAGGVGSESVSANVAIVVPFVWPIGIRLKKNKNYVGGIPEAEIDLNTPSSAIRDVLFEGYAALIDRARLFTPAFTWRWVGTSAWLDGALRTEQEWWEIQGPQLDRQFLLGQRRRRLP